MNAPAQLRFQNLAPGQQAGFEAIVTTQDVDRFVALSGDASPLHIDAGFARSRGFGDRVVHGAYLTALVSRLVGMVLPGQEALLQAINMQFRSPLLVESRVRVEATVEQLSEAVQVAVLKVSITALEDGRTVASGRVHVGFTTPA